MRSIVLLSVGLACASLAACSSVLGIQDWQDPLTASGGAATASSARASASSTGGVGGAGAGGASTSVSVGAGGYPACDQCAAAMCSNEMSACSGDDQCKIFETCIGDIQDCCQRGGPRDPNATSQSLWSCLNTNCIDVCYANATCADCFQNGLETDVDCGGDDCSPCGSGKRCNGDGDCASLHCDAGVCR